MTTQSAESQMIVITADNFQSEVLNAEVPVLVDFWAEWCPPCRALSPIMEELASEYGQRVKVGKLDVDANSTLAAKYEVSSIPTVLLFVGGEIKARWVGLRPRKDYRAAIDEQTL